MAEQHLIPHFQNEAGVETVEIGVREFMCVGAKPPFDHPHIFIDLGDEDEKVCSYCATHYRYRRVLGPLETNPPGHLYEPAAAA